MTPGCRARQLMPAMRQSGSDFDRIARHFLTLRLVFARFDTRQIGPRLPPAAPRARNLGRAGVRAPIYNGLCLRRIPCLRPCGLRVVPVLMESSVKPLRCCWCLLDLTRVKSGRACLPRQARQPRRPGREGFRARSTLKSVHWTDLTPPGRGRVSPRQARPDLPAIGVRRFPCLRPCGLKQSGRAFPRRGTATPTI